MTQRVCTLMARIEGEQHGSAGGVREWLARAVNAPRDPAWTADGVVAENWAPISPVTGKLDAFRWRVPVEAVDQPHGTLLSSKIEALVGLGAQRDALIEQPNEVGRAAAAMPLESSRSPAGSVVPDMVSTPEAPLQSAPKIDRPQTQVSQVPLQPRKEGVDPNPQGGAPPHADKGRLEAVELADEPPRRQARTPRAIKPHIFTPPRAPDDPGTEADEEMKPLESIFHRSEAKS
jgi:HemY protein